MSSQDPEGKGARERGDTDASLRAERTRTDQELARTRGAVNDAADRVVEVARELAEETLQKARSRADSGAHATVPGQPPSASKLEHERATEDAKLAKEGGEAAERLQEERRDRQRALTALLRLEREATDEGLLLERARADEALAARDNFLAMVTHDLRNMLGGIALDAAVLANPRGKRGEPPFPATVTRYGERIQRFTARMNRMVGDLLDVVSLEAGKLHVTATPIDSGQLVTDASEAFHASFSSKGVALRTSMPTERLITSADHDRILQVLANLLSNALKFTETGGEVTLALSQDATGVLFSVTDTGTGISAEHTATIFERFRQVDPTDRRGLGLGLYIAKSIVDAHGGTIWASRPPSGGTAVQFTLPFASAG